MLFLPWLAAVSLLVPSPGPTTPGGGVTAVQKGSCRLELNGKPLACAVVSYAFAPSIGRTSFNAAIGGDAFGFSGLSLQPRGAHEATLAVDTLVAHRQSQNLREPASGQCAAATSEDHRKLLSVTCHVTGKSGAWTLSFKADGTNTLFLRS